MEYGNCDLCGNKDFILFYNGFNFNRIDDTAINVVRCTRCGFVRTYPKLAADEIMPYYNEDYYGIKNMRFKGIIESLIHLKRRIRAKRILKYRKSGRILDIGCGRGIFLDEMRKRGWETYGTEISAVAGRHSKEILKLNIYIGQFEKALYPDAHFDVVTLYHVLEHLTEPISSINEIKRILKPNGMLVISVPNIHSWQAMIFGHYWFHLDVPRHYFHFSQETLKLLLPATDWKVLKVKKSSFEHGPFGWIQSTLNVLYGNETILYEILKENTSGTLGQYARKRFKVFRWTTILFNILTGIILAVPAVILSLISAMTDYTEIIEVYYEKK